MGPVIFANWLRTLDTEDAERDSDEDHGAQDKRSGLASSLNLRVGTHIHMVHVFHNIPALRLTTELVSQVLFSCMYSTARQEDREIELPPSIEVTGAGSSEVNGIYLLKEVSFAFLNAFSRGFRWQDILYVNESLSVAGPS